MSLFPITRWLVSVFLTFPFFFWLTRFRSRARERTDCLRIFPQIWIALKTLTYDEVGFWFIALQWLRKVCHSYFYFSKHCITPRMSELLCSWRLFYKLKLLFFTCSYFEFYVLKIFNPLHSSISISFRNRSGSSSSNPLIVSPDKHPRGQDCRNGNN